MKCFMQYRAKGPFCKLDVVMEQVQVQHRNEYQCRVQPTWPKPSLHWMRVMVARPTWWIATWRYNGPFYYNGYDMSVFLDVVGKLYSRLTEIESSPSSSPGERSRLFFFCLPDYLDASFCVFGELIVSLLFFFLTYFCISLDSYYQKVWPWPMWRADDSMPI